MNINPNNMSPEKMNMLLNMASRKLGVSTESLVNSMQNGDFSNALGGMSPDAQAKFNNIVSNPKEIEKIVNSPQAQELMRRLMEGKK